MPGKECFFLVGEKTLLSFVVHRRIIHWILVRSKNREIRMNWREAKEMIARRATLQPLQWIERIGNGQLSIFGGKGRPLSTTNGLANNISQQQSLPIVR